MTRHRAPDATVPSRKHALAYSRTDRGTFTSRVRCRATSSGFANGRRPFIGRHSTWVEGLGLDPAEYGTHSMRRTKATLIYRRTKNLRAVQLLLGHSKLESTVRYLGIEVDDALEISEQTEI
jgi:integrase